MITQRAVGNDRASKVAQLHADNARLRRLAAEIEADVRELRASVGVKRGRPAVDPAHRLLVVSGAEREVR
jgi:malonyl CoA-acyl carrier protein transacylase